MSSYHNMCDEDHVAHFQVRIQVRHKITLLVYKI